MATLKTVPPFDSSVRGHAPFGAGTMSAGCLRCVRSAFAETTILRYGFAFDATRWQIAVTFDVLVLRALALESATLTTTSASTTDPATSRFTVLPLGWAVVALLTGTGRKRMGSDRAGAQPRGELVRLERLAEREPLRRVGPERGELGPRLVGRDALRKDVHAEALPERDRGADDGRVVRVRAHREHERAVDLDLADGQLAQVVERRVAGAEVVDREPHAQLVELVEDDLGAERILQHRRLRELELQQRRVRAGHREEGGDVVRERRVEDVPRRDVHRHAQPEALLLPRERLLERALGDVERERPHEAGLLRLRDEVLRLELAALRVEPADERLDRAHRPVGERGLRLVAEDELLVLDRAPQLRGERELLGIVGVARRLVERVAMARVLGLVHRDVGLLHQLRHVVPVVGREGDADRGLDRQRQPVVVDGELDRQAQLLEQELELARVDLSRQDEAELVAAQTRDRVGGADAVLEALPHDLEDVVAGGVAEGVVDLLEAVEIHEEHRDPAAVAPRRQQRALDPVGEERAIRKAGQRVVERLVLGARGVETQLLLGPLALRDVLDHVDRELRLPRRVAYERDGERAPQDLPVLADVAQLGAVRLALAAHQLRVELERV